jgi:hypothetical protein
MKPAKIIVLAGLVTGIVAGGVWIYKSTRPTRRKPEFTGNPFKEGFDPNKPQIGIAVATGYNDIAINYQQIDLTHLEKVEGWRYSGGYL